MTEYTNSRSRAVRKFRHWSGDCRRKTATGFTLTELAIVLVIVALLIGGMLAPLSAQRDIQNTNENRKQMEEIKEALFGFAAANGRLPCPASPAATGAENPVGGGSCVNSGDGFLPGITLGIGPTDAQGYVVDSLGNRIRYAVTSANSDAFTKLNGLQTIWGSAITISPNIHVCNTSVGISGAACAANADLTTSAAAVIISSGKNGSAIPTGADELANTDANITFVSHLPSPASAAQGEFDDIVIWISPNILYNRMISAGRLP